MVEIELRAPDGTMQKGHAQVTVYDIRDRVLRAAATGLAGIGIGGLSILLPGFHLVATWAGPLVGAGLAVTTVTLRAWVSDVEGPCPACGQPLHNSGPGPLWTESPTVPCPHCNAAIEVHLLG